MRKVDLADAGIYGAILLVVCLATFFILDTCAGSDKFSEATVTRTQFVPDRSHWSTCMRPSTSCYGSGSNRHCSTTYTPYPCYIRVPPEYHIWAAEDGGRHLHFNNERFFADCQNGTRLRIKTRYGRFSGWRMLTNIEGTIKGRQDGKW